jgi:DNA-binding response OmpR family regulator
MKTKALNILAIGRDEAIMQVVHRLLNAHEAWTGSTATTDEGMNNALDKGVYDIVLLCAGITGEEEKQWREKLQGQHTATIVLRHYGGGSGLLENEILAALDNLQT